MFALNNRAQKNLKNPELEMMKVIWCVCLRAQFASTLSSAAPKVLSRRFFTENFSVKVARRPRSLAIKSFKIQKN